MKKRSNGSAATRRSRRSTFTLTTAGARRAAAVTIAVWRERVASCPLAAGPAAVSAAATPQMRGPRMGGNSTVSAADRERDEARLSGGGGAWYLALAPPPHCEPAERCDCAQRYDDAERPDAPGHQIDEVPPRLLERFCHDARAGVPDDGNRLVYADRERAQGLRT